MNSESLSERLSAAECCTCPPGASCSVHGKKVGFTTLTGMDDIYSPENIARTRRRAAQMRQQIEAGDLSPAEDWQEVVANMEADADERERTGRPDPSTF